MFKEILFSEYANFHWKESDGTVWNYDNMVLKQFPLPEPVIPGAAGHPYGYFIGKSGALYMLWGDSVKWQKIADNVKLVAAYWEWAVVVDTVNVITIYQHGKVYAILKTILPDIQQVAAAHYVLFRDVVGTVWQLNWADKAWRSGLVWQKPADRLKLLVPTKVPLPGPATDITTTRTQHSTAIVDGWPYTWCDPVGAKYVGLPKATDIPINMKDIWKLPEKITKVRSSDNTTHVITVSGRLFGGGVNDLGEVGNGMKEATVLATGKWGMTTKLIQIPFVEVGKPGEFYIDIFKGTSYGHRTAIITDKGIIRFCGRNKYGLCDNGIYPEQPSDSAKLFEGMWSVATFRWAVFPERLVLKTADEGRAMIAAGTYPPPEPNTTPVPIPNKPPVVNAGQDIEVTMPIERLKLSAEAMDTDGTISSYAWTQVNGAGIIIENGDTATPEILIKGVGDYEFEVVVKDDKGLAAKDSVKVRVNPKQRLKTHIIHVYDNGEIEVEMK